MVVAFAAPLSDTVDPFPLLLGLIVPEMLNVRGGFADALKFAPVILAAVTVPRRPDGEKLNPLLLGMTVYVPLERLLNVKFPLLSVIVVRFAAPLRVSITPLLLAGGLIVPEMLNLDPEELLDAVKSFPVMLAVLTAAF